MNILILRTFASVLNPNSYNSQEIGDIVGADAGTVRMWMTRARKYLKGLPELQQYAEAV